MRRNLRILDFDVGENVKKLFSRIIIISSVAFAIFLAICWYVIFKLPDAYENSYQKGFLYQYQALERSVKDVPKIVIIGGSYMNFATDIDLMQELTGMPSYLLGIHSGMGMQYTVDVAKKLLNPGDILVYDLLCREDSIWSKDDYGTQLIYQTYSGNTLLLSEFMREYPLMTMKSASDISRRKLKTMITNEFKSSMPPTKEDTIDNAREPTGYTVYDARAFDSVNGNLLYPRLEQKVADDLSISNYFDTTLLTPERIEIMNLLFGYCHLHGIQTYMTFSAICKSYVGDSNKEIDDFVDKLENEVDVTIISDPREFLFDKKYFYNSVVHASSLGADMYTRLLCADIVKALHETQQAVA